MPDFTELHKWTDWIPVIQSVLMFLTVVISAITVYVAVCKQKTDRESSVRAIEKAEEQARKRAIIDLLIAQKSDPNYIKDSKIVRALKSDSTACLANEINSPDSAKKDAILSVLNQLEFIAVGIRIGVFDEELYKQLCCHSVLKTWEAASGFVYELRKQTHIKTLYQDLEYLSNRWEKSPIKQIH